MPNPNITFPASYVSPTAVAFAQADGSAQLVSIMNPLPVSAALNIGGSTLAVTAADGAQVTLGAMADATASSDSGSFSLMSLTKRMLGKLAVGQKAMAGSLAVTMASDQTNLEPGGVAIAGATMPTGGLGLTGWLSAIYKACASATPAGTNLIGSTQPNYVAPASWAGASFDGRAFAQLVIAITAAPTTAYAMQWSPDGTTWFALSGIDLGFTQQSNIPIGFTGAITVHGGGYVKLSGGAGGTFFICGGQ